MVNLCIVNEDHPPCNVPRKAIKACLGWGSSLSWALSSPLALSHLESGHAAPFSPQDFCSPCVFVYCRHNTGSRGPGSASLMYLTHSCMKELHLNSPKYLSWSVHSLLLPEISKLARRDCTLNSMTGSFPGAFPNPERQQALRKEADSFHAGVEISKIK